MPYMPEGFVMQPLRSIVHRFDDDRDDSPKWDAKADRAERRAQVAALCDQGFSDSQVAAQMNTTVHAIKMIKAILRKENASDKHVKAASQLNKNRQGLDVYAGTRASGAENREKIVQLLREGKTKREIARLLGCTRNNVCLHIARARKEGIAC